VQYPPFEQLRPEENPGVHTGSDETPTSPHPKKETIGCRGCT